MKLIFLHIAKAGLPEGNLMGSRMAEVIAFHLKTSAVRLRDFFPILL